MATKRKSSALRAAAESNNVIADEVLPEKPIAGEFGISGTSNWSGDIQDEANPALYPQLAFGNPGQREWGFYTRALRTDPAVAAGLEYQASMLRDAAVGVTPAEADGLNPAEAQRHADFVKWNLTQATEPGWAELIQQIAIGALSHGHAIREECWEVVQHELLPTGTGYAVTKLAERLPVSVEPNGWKEENGELKTIRQTGQGKDGKWATVDLPASKVSLFSWNRTANNYRGVSHLRPVYHLIRVREQLIKLTGVTLVREGAGIPVAFTTDPKAKLTSEQRRKLQRLLANLVFHENASAVLPAGWNIQWIYSPGANKGHVVDCYNALGLVILQQFQAQHLFLGSGDTGSRAVGEVHTAQARHFAKGVIAFVLGVFNGVGKRPYTGLVKKIVDANFGPQKAYPRLTLSLQRSELPPQDLALAAKTAKDGGLLTVTAKDENKMREALGFEPIDERDREAELERRRSMLPQMPGDDEENEEEDEGGKVLPFEKKKASAVFVPRRLLRPSERVLDLAAMDSKLTDARAEFEAGVKPLLIEALVRLGPGIKEAMADGDASEVAALKLPTSRIEEFVAKYLAELRDAGYREVAKEFRRGTGRDVLERRNKGLPMKALKAAEEEKDPPGYTPEPDPTPPKADKVLESMKKHIVRRIEQRVMSDVEREANEAFRRGDDEADVVANTVQRQLDSGGLKSDAGVLVTKAFNMGREDFAAERGDEVESVELSAILDGKQCIPCDRLDGQTFTPFSEEHVAHVPPLSSICDGGDACRCLLVYNFK